MEIIYDTEQPKTEEAETPRVLYDDPIEERANPHITGELEEMLVDAEHKVKLEDIKDHERMLLTQIRQAFSSRRGDFVTYQEIMAWAKTGTTLCVRPDYQGKSNPRLTRMLNRLHKAGLIRKYYRGLWCGVEYGKWAGQITGSKFGVAFWIW